jgi:hypothetical protein
MTRYSESFTADLDLTWRYKYPPEFLVVVRELPLWNLAVQLKDSL